MKQWRLPPVGGYSLVFTYSRKNCVRLYPERLHPGAYDGYTGAPLFSAVVEASLQGSKPEPVDTKSTTERNQVVASGVAFCSLQDHFDLRTGALLALRRVLASCNLSKEQKEDLAEVALRWLKNLYPGSHFYLTRPLPPRLARRGWRLIREIS